MARVREQERASVSVWEAAEDFLASPAVKRLQPTSIEEYEMELGRFTEWSRSQKLLLNQVNAKVIDTFLDYLKAKRRKEEKKPELSTYTLHSQVRVILTFLHWCLDDEEYSQHVKADVVRRIKKPQIIKTITETFTPEQIASLRKACAREYNAHLRLRDEAIILCLLDSGIRASELCTLSIARVDLSPADPHIRVFGKGQKWGEVGMGSETRKLMSQYLRRFRQPTLDAEIQAASKGKKLLERQITRLEKQLKETSPFFMSRHGSPLTTSGLYRMVERLGDWAKIEGVRCSPHTFRHTFSSMFIRNGGDIYTLSKLLRHSSVKVTEEYLKSIRQWEARHHAQSVVDNL